MLTLGRREDVGSSRGQTRFINCLPADTTFVWDPVSDTVAAVYDGMTGSLLRQIIHGGLGYDDPIEIELIDPGISAVKRVYPVFDEAGNGNLQAVLDASGNLIARADQADPYGADRSVLVGPAVERITWRAAKGEDGSIEHVDVEVRVSEMLDAASVGDGVRVVAHAPNGEVLRTSDGAAELIDPFTMRLRLSSSEWTALVDGAGFIAAAATSSARGAAWSDAQPILEAPDWVVALGRAMRSAEHPVEVRDSLASLASWLASIPAASEGEHVVYHIDDPALLASGPESDSIIRFLTLSPFQALPFIDSVTGHSLARRRWLDHTTGTFLTPDPLGFVDSPNLYAYAGGDPVNGRDPRGEARALLPSFGRIVSFLRESWRESRRKERAARHAFQEDLHQGAREAFIEARADGSFVRADDLLSFSADGHTAITYSGNVILNPGAGVIEDQSAGIALNIAGVRPALMLLKSAYTSRQWARVLAIGADEAGAVVLGVNPSLPIHLGRSGYHLIESAGAYPRGDVFISATARTSRSVRTAVVADLGETAAYKEALLRGEVGLLAPQGANLRGLDFLTAVRDRRGQIVIIFTDAKSSTEQ